MAKSAKELHEAVLRYKKDKYIIEQELPIEIILLIRDLEIRIEDLELRMGNVEGVFDKEDKRG